METVGGADAGAVESDGGRRSARVVDGIRRRSRINAEHGLVLPRRPFSFTNFSGSDVHHPSFPSSVVDLRTGSLLPRTIHLRFVPLPRRFFIPTSSSFRSSSQQQQPLSQLLLPFPFHRPRNTPSKSSAFTPSTSRSRNSSRRTERSIQINPLVVGSSSRRSFLPSYDSRTSSFHSYRTRTSTRREEDEECWSALPSWTRRRIEGLLAVVETWIADRGSLFFETVVREFRDRIGTSSC